MAKMLDSGAVSAFCESVAVMYSAGIQTDEAVAMLSENMGRTSFKKACDRVYRALIGGKNMATAMQESRSFPAYAVQMVAAGEHSGHLEDVLWELSRYYDEEERLFTKIKNAIAYPAALLCIMSLILLFTVIVILPVFINVYDNFTGGIAAGSIGFVNASLIIGYVALGVVLFFTAIAIITFLISRTPGGRRGLIKLLEKLPFTRKPLRLLAVSRFTSALSTCISAGISPEAAMDRAIEMSDNRKLKKALRRVRAEMVDPGNPKNLAQAIYDNHIYSPMFSRMLLVGSRAGSIEEVLSSLASYSFDESISDLDRLIDSVEPVLAAFLTIAVGCTLISVMLPLIGIMNSIG